MKVILPNCRVQFTAADIDFILSVLQPDAPSHESLVALLADADSRDLILDDEKLFRAVLESRGCLRISTHIYFYILVRHMLRRSGLEDRDVADYVAEMLAEFSRAGSLQCRLPGQTTALEYFVDMLAALPTADEATSFGIRAHMGNQSLFMMGVFPERIRYRTDTRAAPGFKYYEALGRENYRLAGDHQLARKYNLAGIFNTLSERFQTARQALNEVSDRLVSLGEVNNPSVETLLNAAFPSRLN